MIKTCETCLRGPEPQRITSCIICIDYCNFIPLMEKKMTEEDRIDVIGSNGNDGLHYDQPPCADEKIWKVGELQIYPTKMEIYEVSELICSLEMIDYPDVSLKMHRSIRRENIQETFNAINAALQMMDMPV
jgi:hypothetical protein